MNPSLLDKNLRPIFSLYSKTFGVAAARFHRQGFLYPSKVTFKITNICNVDCHFCYNAAKNTRAEKKQEIDLESWKKVVDSLPFYSVISFTGGEAFLYPGIFELLEHIRRRGRKASVVSNGTTLRAPDLERLIDCSLHYLMFSLHGLAPTHNRILNNDQDGGRDHFTRTVETIQKLQELKRQKQKTKPVVSIKTVITEENCDEIPALLKFCEEELGASHLYFNLLSDEPFETFDTSADAFRARTPMHVYSREKLPDLLRLMDFIFDYKKRSRLDIGFTNGFRSKEALKNFLRTPESYRARPCNKPFHEVYVQPNGDVTLCLKQKLTTLQELDYDFGNLYRIPKYQELLTQFNRSGRRTSYCNVCLEACFEGQA